MDDQQFETIMSGIKDVRDDLADLGKTVLSHDRDIRAVKVVGKFIGGTAAVGVGLVAFYETVLSIFNLRK